jgi:hypothetical protein
MAVTRTPRKTKNAAAKAPVVAKAAKTAAPQAVKYPAVTVPRTSMEDWPPQAELILSAIEAGQHRMGYNAGADRRTSKRVSFRVRAQLRLYSDNPGDTARVVYTRDIHARGLGFITPHRLPLGHGGLVDLPTPTGKIVSIPCTLLRCREAAPGWYEGSVYFNREQQSLVPPPRVA